MYTRPQNTEFALYASFGKRNEFFINLLTVYVEFLKLPHTHTQTPTQTQTVTHTHTHTHTHTYITHTQPHTHSNTHT